MANPVSEDHLLPSGQSPKLIEGPEVKRPKRRSSRSKMLLFGGLALVLLAMVFLLGYLPRHKREKVVEAAAQREAHALPSVNVSQVRRAPNASYLLLPGNITPLTEAYLYARATGYVRKRYADIGDRVREGQLLAEIEAPDLDAQVAQARAALSQAEQQLAQSRAALENAVAQEDLARVTWDRYRVLASHGAVSRQEADQQEAAYKQATANVHLQQASVNTAQENIRGNRANLERLIALQEFERVRAPFSGVITARNFDVGAFINGGGGSSGTSSTPMGGTQSVGAQGNAGSSGTPPSSGSSATSPTAGGGSGGELFRVAQIGTVRILVNVPQASAPSIRAGQPAAVLVQEYSGRNFYGKVTRTSSSLDQASRTLLAEVQVANPQSLLLPGMYAQVQFGDLRTQPPLLVPGDAVITMPDGLNVAILQDLTPQDRQKLERQREHEQANPKQSSANEADRQQRQQEQQPEQTAKRVHLQRVAVGRDYGPEIEISGGLQGWEYLIVNPGDEVQEGALVTPRGAPPIAGQGGSEPRGPSEQQPAEIGMPAREAPTQGPPSKSGGKGGNQGKGGGSQGQGKSDGSGSGGKKGAK